MSRGHNRERAVRKLMEAEGWWVSRAAGSLGDADLVALKAGFPPRLVEVKSEVQSTWHGFGPADRQAIKDAARKAGAEAWFVCWPPRQPPRWIHEDDWPVAA
jgi:Holliday junction resolvase